MNNQPQHDPGYQTNMTPDQSPLSGYNEPRSQQSTSNRSGVTNTQQVPSNQLAPWSNPAHVAQYYQQAQNVQQVPSFIGTFQMQNQHNMQSFPAASFGNSNYQATFDPTALMMQNWQMANSAQHGGYNQEIPHSLQQYHVQQHAMQQATLQQRNVQQTYYPPASFPQQQSAHTLTEVENDHKVTGAFSNEILDFEMDDPSAQLMGELHNDIPESARSPTPPARQSARETEVPKSDVNIVNLPGFMNYETTDFKMGTDDEQMSAPQDDQEFDHEIFKSFEQEVPSTEADKVQDAELADQVDQVVADLNDEEMQDSDSGEHRSTPEYTETTSSDEHDLDFGSDIDVNVDTEDYAEDPCSESENSVAVNKGLSAKEDLITEDDTERIVTDDEETKDHALEDEIEDGEVSDVASISGAEAEAHESTVETSHEVEFEGFSLTVSPFKTIKKKLAKKEDKELHNKAIQLQPHHLPAHRYWIAVLMHTVAPHKAKSSTVETMWNEYRNVTTEEQHQILFCGKAPQFTDAIEELDIFDDKLVVFRAAKQEIIVID
ncbi:hypothetical protein E4T39_07895 [Aureobasidium subglaciale]|nr:hypothetical protein E4T39_07895 [Aureobasidium subglaciale]